MTMVLRTDRGNLVDIAELPTEADVATALQVLDHQRATNLPCLWQLTVDTDSDPTWGSGPAVWLNAGIAGSTGMLRWVDRSGEYIPAAGAQRLTTTPERLAYFDWSGTACSVHAALQVPIALVLAAVTELTATRRRPACLEWTPMRGHQPLVGLPVGEHSAP
jgi:Immunity protein Imm1